MRTAVFVNGRSRQTRRVLDRLKNDLADSQFNINAFIVIGPFRRFTTGINRLQQINNLECVIIAGGDGTIIGVLNALKNLPKLKIGILPLGTGNSFVRSVGLPLVYDEAIAAIKAGQTRQANLASVNGHIFVNAAAIGLSEATARRISDTTKRYFGRLAYLFSGGRQLLRHKPFLCKIVTAKKTYEVLTHELLIVNGSYYGARRVDNHTSVFKDYLTFIVLGTGKSRLRYVKNHALLLLGSRPDDNGPLRISAKQATVTTTPRRLIHADGEVVSKTPANFRIKSKAITVFVP